MIQKLGRARQRGFTLLEIMVVVIIIGVLAVIVVQNVLPQADKARITAAKADIRTLAAALDTYRLDNSFYPSTNQGLEALVNAPSGTPEARNWGPEPYMRKLPVDPWGNTYVYTNEGFVFEIVSLGADGEEGGDGIATDIKFSDL
ncbi:MAG: type II secretion system major pseudopilin GspG [Gammaproteobacteria bacterium]|nr:type II secretion system major pseudopilin GspG [Gammaproteobacteria bacterium]